MAVFKKLVIPNGNKDITENGDVDISGYASVNVNVQPELQSKTTTPTTSEQEIIADESYYGLSKVIVDPIPNEYIVPSESIEITENGTYDVTDYASANVNVEDVIEVPQVSNLAIDEDGVLTYDEPDYSELEKYNPTISYLINVNGDIVETSGSNAYIKGYVVEGENSIAITTKVLIKGLAKEDVVEYVASEEGKYTIFTFNLTDATQLQPTIYGTSSSYIKTWAATIDWGDGTVDEYNDTTSTKMEMSYQKSTPYSTIGKYTVKIKIHDVTNKYVPAFAPTSYSGASDLRKTYVVFLTSVENIQEGFSGYNKYSFYGSNTLINFNLASYISDIPDGFINSDSLVSIVVPEIVTSIGMSGLAFKGGGTFFSDKRSIVIMKPTIPPTLVTNGLIGTGYMKEIRVPASAVDAYKTATNWSSYASIIVADTEE